MAAPKGNNEKDKLFNEIINDISENGLSAVKAFKGKMSSATFYDLLKDEEKLNKYARATESRAELLADETIEIADGTGNDIITLPDGREVEDQRVIARDKLRVETRKWLLAKLHPKKYGDRTILAGDKENPLIPPQVIFQDISEK